MSTGDLYDRLMDVVEPAINGQTLESVTFIWMQGERDAKMQWGGVYQASLKGLYELNDSNSKKDEARRWFIRESLLDGYLCLYFDREAGRCGAWPSGHRMRFCRQMPLLSLSG